MMEKIPHTEAKSFQYWQLDSPFEIWFRYWLRYWPKVLVDMGFGFGKVCIIRLDHICFEQSASTF